MSAHTLRVPWSMSSEVDVRRAVVLELHALEVDTTIVDEAEIVLSELVANAVRHAKPLPDGTIRVSWTVRAGVVEVEVADGGGPTTPRPAPRALLSVTGRGLRIVPRPRPRVGSPGGSRGAHGLGLARRPIPPSKSVKPRRLPSGQWRTRVG